MTPPDRIRAKFAMALSEMYRLEAPRYRALAALVDAVNGEVLRARPDLRKQLEDSGELDRLAVECHGAVRVGAAAELSTLRRMFAVMGMAPVGYYDLSVAGLPVHSTAFRPLTDDALRRHPFRVFTSLLRVDLIEDKALRAEVESILARRNIVTPACARLLDLFEEQGAFTDEQSAEFVSEAVETFRFRPQTTVSMAVYRKLCAAHPLIADIACFRGPHINHLTLATIDIDAVQRAMSAQGLDPKDAVEGPPARCNPILLRQTSFKAQPEPIRFDEPGEAAYGTHAARFGEVEQRGAALTEKGRALYDRLLAKALAAPKELPLEDVFRDFPDDVDAMRRERLAFFRYCPTEKGLRAAGQLAALGSVEKLLRAQALWAEPIVYEDFLPVSAAGIFRSNLDNLADAKTLAPASRTVFEEALGVAVIDPSSLYEAAEAASLAASLDALRLSPAIFGHLPSSSRSCSE
jgi:uncharacterized glyoxalase superfamily metalloenzyme YdcJ